MSDIAEKIPETALDWHRSGQGAALATVVETWGSAPRPVGAQLAVSGAGAIVGSVSGGCVEGAVVIEAQETLADGQTRLLEFGVSDDQAFAVGLACGGSIRVMVEPVGQALPADLLETLTEARAARTPVAYVVQTKTWTRRLAGVEDFPDRFARDKSGLEDDGATFIGIHNPPLRMAIVGAGHVAQPLSSMALLAGYDVTIIDPREAFATSTRFPDLKISHDWPDAALSAHGLDSRTALVTLAHDPKIDDPAIIAALNSQVFYIGSLGSSRTHAKRVERLRAAGIDDAGIARIHGPVGLDIKGRSPAEIAISIMAEITQVMRAG